MANHPLNQRKWGNDVAAAEVLGVSVATVRKWRVERRNVIPYYRVGGRIRYDLDEVQAAAVGRRSEPLTEPDRRFRGASGVLDWLRQRKGKELDANWRRDLILGMDRGVHGMSDVMRRHCERKGEELDANWRRDLILGLPELKRGGTS